MQILVNLDHPTYPRRCMYRVPGAGRAGPSSRFAPQYYLISALNNNQHDPSPSQLPRSNDGPTRVDASPTGCKC